MPTKARRSASLEEAYNILSLILAISGDLVDEGKKMRGESHYSCKLRFTDRDLPADENHLVPLPTICCLKLEVVNSPPTLGFGEVTEEFVIICGRARLLDDDLSFVLVEVIDDVFVLVFKLESLELGETGIIDAYT